eukprot:1141821-Ditylum_brightwellii.AAC.1
MELIKNYHSLFVMYKGIMGYHFSSHTGLDGFTITDKKQSPPNNKNIEIGILGVGMFYLQEGEDEGLFVESVLTRVETLRSKYLEVWHRDHPKDDPTLAHNGPLHGLMIG